MKIQKRERGSGVPPTALKIKHPPLQKNKEENTLKVTIECSSAEITALVQERRDGPIEERDCSNYIPASRTGEYQWLKEWTWSDVLNEIQETVAKVIREELLGGNRTI